MDKELILQFFARFIAFLTAIPIHESAHGLIAYKLGDPTAKSMGRITLNPIKHFDLFGTLCLLFVGIGWAKPVPIDARYFKNPKAGMALTAAAGPVSNFLLAFVSMIIHKLLLYWSVVSRSQAVGYLATVFLYMVVINCMLAIFNLIPVPPFDGGRIFTFFLPEKWYFAVMRYERYIYLVVIVLVFMGVLDKPLVFLREQLINALDWLTRFVDIIMIKILS